MSVVIMRWGRGDRTSRNVEDRFGKGEVTREEKQSGWTSEE